MHEAWSIHHEKEQSYGEKNKGSFWPPTSKIDNSGKEHRRNDTWEDCIVKARAVIGYFMRWYKMTEASFNKLVDILDFKSKNGTGGVSSRLLYLGAGTSMKSSKGTHHLSLSSAKRIVRCVPC
jgi:hypothetical protein